jgi:putative ABC transport system permease protein
MLADLRYAIRMLIKSPAFSVIAIVALALGIGANTAIFSVVDAVLLRPLPYPEPDKLILLRERMQIFESGSVSYPNYLDWRASQHVFTDLALYRRDSMNLSSRDESSPPERIAGGVMSFNMMKVVGLRPMLGRDFIESDDVPNGPKVALISEGLWRRHFGSSKNVLGQQLIIDAIPREIIGVLPNEMGVVLRKAEVFLPLGNLRAEKGVLQRDNHPGFSVLGRLKPSVTLTQARAELDNIAHELSRRYPESNTGRTINARTLLEAGVGDYRQSLQLLLIAVGCVLLIACANVVNLQLARALSRSKELAVRAAMGASRWRLMRLLLIESTVLGIIGGAVGLLIGIWSLDAIHALSPPQSVRFQETRIDILTLGFTTAIALVCGVLVGVWPAWRVSRLASLAGVLHEAGTRTGSESFGKQRTRGILVVTQVALALILLAGAGLTLKSFWRSLNAPLGFDADHILTMTLSLPEARYDSNEKVIRYYQQLTERIAALPGVSAAAIGENVPFDDTEWDSSFHITGTPPSTPGQEPSAEVNVVTPDYFKVLKMTILRGRTFGPEDRPNQPRSVIIDDRSRRVTSLGRIRLGSTSTITRLTMSTHHH